MRTWATCGFCSRSADEFARGFRDQQHADVQPGQFRRRGPFQERHQVHPLIDAGAASSLAGISFSGKSITSVMPFHFFFSSATRRKKRAQQRRERVEILAAAPAGGNSCSRRCHRSPATRKTASACRRAEGQPVADIVEQQADAIRKQPARQKRFERHVIDAANCPARERGRKYFRAARTANRCRRSSAAPVPAPTRAAAGGSVELQEWWPYLLSVAADVRRLRFFQNVTICDLRFTSVWKYIAARRS